MLDREKHKDDFFNYIIENEKELQKALRKNITYDPDIFDDVTAETIVRIAEYIMKNGIKINNFKYFFFICAKREYIAQQNKKRGITNNSNRDFFDNIFNGLEKREKQEDLDIYYGMLNNDDDVLAEEIKADKVHRLFQYLERKLNEAFPPDEADIFLIYFRLKSEKKGISYKKMALLVDKDLKYITNTIKKIKKYIKESHDIQNKKQEIMKNDD
jgi:DNA-directed RNA polymerase specialized sigma24 family protein